VWTTVAEYNSNAEILALRKTNSNGNYISIDLNSVKAQQIRVRIDTRVGTNSISLNEIQCTGIAINQGKPYSENILLDKAFTLTSDCYTWEATGSDSDGVKGLTDGTYRYSENPLLWRTWYNKDYLKFDGIVDLGGEAVLNELRLFVYQGDYACLSPGIQIYYYYNGEWTLLHDITISNSADYNLYKREDTLDTTSVEQWMSVDMEGVKAEKLRIYLPPKTTGAYGFCEITLDGYYEPDGSTVSTNLFDGYEFVPTDAAAAKVWQPYTYDNLTDGLADTANRLNTSGTASFVDATITFGDSIAEFDIFTINYGTGWAQVRSGTGLILDVLGTDGTWTEVLNVTYDTMYTGKVNYDLGGAKGVALRMRVPGVFPTAVDNVAKGDSICIMEVECAGSYAPNKMEYTTDVFTGYQFVPTDSTASANIWSPNTYDKITDDGATNDTSSRFATANGHTADGTLDFGGKVAQLNTLTVNFDPYTAARCGQDFNIYVYRNGEWTHALSHTHTAPTKVETFELGGIEAEKVRFTVTSKYNGGANADGTTGDCVVIYEMSCTGYLYTPELDQSEDKNSNILLGTTSDKLTVSGANVHTGAAVNNLANAFDGNLNTRYAVFDASPYSYSLEIELSAIYPLYTLTFYPFFNSGEKSRSDNTKIEVCLDGIWVTVVEGFTIDASTSSSVSLSGVKANRIRVTFANTTWNASASIYEIQCTTGSATAIDRRALLEAYKTLDELDVSAEYSVEEAKEMKLKELTALLMNTEATQDDIDSYVDTVTDATAKYESSESLVTDSYGDFSSYNLSLAGDIGFNFYGELSASVATEFPDAFVVVEYTKYENKTATVATEKILLSDLEKIDARTVLTIDLPAAQMTDTVKIRLVLDGDNIGRCVEETVRSYADKILADDAYASSHNIIKAMLNYGGAAQTYFGYNTENLASTGVDAATITGSTISAGTLVTSGSLTGINPAGWSLALDSNVNMRFYFSTDNISRYAFRVTSPDGGTVDLLPELMDDGTYRVEIKTTDAKLMDDTYRLVVEDLSSATSISITVNAMKYIERMASGAINGNQALKALGEAMELYCIAANEYNA